MINEKKENNRGNLEGIHEIVHEIIKHATMKW